MSFTLQTPVTGAPNARSESGLVPHKSMFISPAPAGRRITAGFSYVQRIGHGACIDVWFPDAVHETVQKILISGKPPGPSFFPAQWAAVRQFELLQESGNINIIDLDPTQLLRTIRDVTRFMHGGGYRVTVVTIGGYAAPGAGDDELEILDRRLQDRIARLINMLYLEEQSEKINAAMEQTLRARKWNYQTALPHVGVTLGARALFRPPPPAVKAITVKDEIGLIPSAPHRVAVDHAGRWIDDLAVKDPLTEKRLTRVNGNPHTGQYAVAAGTYYFAAADAWKEVLISYRYEANADGRKVFSEADRRQRLSRHFFEILGLLPQNHIVHDTAIGLQLPESNNQNQWIYIAQEGEKVGDFVRLMDNLFAPFNKLSLSELHERPDAKPEIKPMVGHMRSYGDRLNPGADHFYRDLAHFASP